MQPYQRLKKIFKRISHMQYIQRILMWDEAVMMPEGAGQARAAALTTLNATVQKSLISKKTKALLAQLNDKTDFSDWDAANLKWMTKRYLSSACVPLRLTEKLTHATLTSEQMWRKLRSQNNWNDFLPYLEKSFHLTKELAERKSQALSLLPYDALLDEYVPGFNQQTIDPIFSKLRSTLPPLIQEILQKQSTNHVHQPTGPFPIEKQKKLNADIMQALQFDFNHGRLDVSHHPFCSGGPTDVRITTRYDEDTFIPSLLGICHETGHGLYEQGLPKKWSNQPVGQVNSMAMHESQSLLIEMEVCRSLAFFNYLTPLLKNAFGNQEAYHPDNLYQFAIKVQPGLIRVDADEVTYPLHVILRYDIEKNLFNGNLLIKDLPAYWDELMTQYLGMSTKTNYKDGVMQDVHWPCGAFGYFPAYTLGRMIASQIFSAFKNQQPHYHEAIQAGQFQVLKNWLSDNVYSKASLLSADELLIKITGNPLSSDYFIEHIKQRYLMSSVS